LHEVDTASHGYGPGSPEVAALDAKRRHFRVYRREDVPARLHYSGNRRIPPVVLIADEGWRS